MKKFESNIFYGVGIAFLLIGVLLFLTFWLMHFGFGCLLVGVFFILVSKKPLRLKLIAIAPPIGFVVGTIINSIASPEVFLIPEGFRGTVYVIFDQENGEHKEHEGLKRVYEIPPSGVLFTQFQSNEGILDQEFFFISKSGKRRRIGVLDVRDYNEEHTINPNPKEPPRDSLAVFNPGAMGRAVDSDNDKDYVYTALTVNTYSNIKELNYLSTDYIDSLKLSLKE